MFQFSRLPYSSVFVVAIVFVILVALSFVIYLPGLHGPLFLDSAKLYGLQQIYAQQGAAVDLNTIRFGGGFGRVIAQLTLYWNIVCSGGVDAFSLKLTNWVIHQINGVLVLMLAAAVLARSAYREHKYWLALGVYACWLISSVNMSSVLYVVQRMNQLSMLFSLLAMLWYLWFRGRAAVFGYSSVVIFVGVFVCLVLGYLSKENAVLIPGFVLLVEFFFFEELRERCKSRRFVFISCAVLVVFALVILWLLYHYNMLNYTGRPYVLEQRLLTEVRIVWHYVLQLVLPHSLATGLYQDGFPLSRSMFAPLTTLFSLAGLLLSLCFVLKFARHAKLRPIAFGVAFFLFGHVLESSIFPLELYFEHRNYLPSFGLYFAFVLLLWHILHRFSKVRIVVILTYVVFVASMAYAKSHVWSSNEKAFTYAIERTYVSPRAAGGMAQLHLERGEIAPALAMLDQVIDNGPNQALNARLQKLYIACAAGLNVRQDFYRELADITTKELEIEVSQALTNVVDVYVKTQCASIDVNRLVTTLTDISSAYELKGKPHWHIDYHIVQLYLSFDKARAYKLLGKKFLAGQTPAGWFLLDLLRQDSSIAVGAELEQALGQLRESAAQ